MVETRRPFSVSPPTLTHQTGEPVAAMTWSGMTLLKAVKTRVGK
jgi:hypothetical protein